MAVCLPQTNCGKPLSRPARFIVRSGMRCIVYDLYTCGQFQPATTAQGPPRPNANGHSTRPEAPAEFKLIPRKTKKALVFFWGGVRRPPAGGVSCELVATDRSVPVSAASCDARRVVWRLPDRPVGHLSACVPVRRIEARGTHVVGF
jgi:hypothetical protein